MSIGGDKEDGRRKGREKKLRHWPLQVGKSSHLEDLVYHAQEFRFYLELNGYLLKIKWPTTQSNFILGRLVFLLCAAYILESNIEDELEGLYRDPQEMN